MAWSSSLTPRPLALAACFVDTWLCNSWDQYCAYLPQGTGLVMGCFVQSPVSAPPEKSPCGYVWLCYGVLAVLWLCLLGQPGEERIQCVCCASQEEWRVCSPMALWGFFQLSSYLSYHGFSEQFTQWATARQHTKIFLSRRGRALGQGGQEGKELEGQELILRVFWNPCPFPQNWILHILPDLVSS